MTKNQVNPVLFFCATTLIPFMLCIDFLGIGVVLPSIASDFSASMDQVHWLITLFAIGYVGFIISITRLADRYGRRPLYFITVIVFILSSILIGLSSALWILVLGRFLQGIAGGAMVMISLAIISSMYSGDKRAKWMGITVGVAGFGMAVGPLVAGFLSYYFSWRSLFFVNIPIGVLVLVCGYYCVPRGGKNPNITYDFPGMILITIVLSDFALVISEQESWGVFSTASIMSHLIWIVGLIVFCIVELKQKNPLVNYKLFTRANFLSSSIIGMMIYFSFSAWVILFSLYLNKVYHYSTLNIGLSLLPFGFFMFLGSLVIGKLLKIFTFRKIILLGILFSFISFIWIAWALDLGIICMMIGFALSGIGFFLVNSTTAPMGLSYLPEAEINIGVGMMQMIRWIGAAIGAPIMSSYLVFKMNSVSFTSALKSSMLVIAFLYFLVFILAIVTLKRSPKK